MHGLLNTVINKRGEMETLATLVGTRLKFKGLSSIPLCSLLCSYIIAHRSMKCNFLCRRNYDLQVGMKRTMIYLVQSTILDAQ